MRRLPAIETIDAVSVICTDNTGTLTRNEMLVASVITVGQAYSVDDEGYSPQGNIEPQPNIVAFAG